LPPLYRHPQNLHRSGGGAAQTNCEPRSGSPNTVSGTKSKSPVKNKYSTERSVSSRRVGSDHGTKKMAETVVPNYDRTSMSEIEWESHMNNHPATVWYKLNSDADVKAAEIDDAQLDRLFRVDLSNHRHFIGRAAGGVSIVIGQERCAYGERVLSTLDLSLSELTETIDSFDKDRMTSKQVRDIIQILPSFEEQEAIREYLDTPDGDFSALHRYEKFVAAMNIIEHVGVKLESILFMQSLSSSIERLRHYFLVVNRSCEEVLASTKLRKILGIVLKIGNRVNFKAQREQNNRSETFAITLDSLPKLKETQTSDRKTTFMHVLIKTIIRSGSAPLLDFKEDMPSIFGNQEMMSWRSAEAEMNRIEFGIDKLREFAVELSTRRIKPMSPHDEVKFLQKSIVGKFILHACLRMAVLVNEYDFAKMKFKSLLRYFGEACSHDRRQPDGVFSIIQTFAQDFDHAYADVSERAENMEFRRNFCSDPHVLPRHPTRQIASPETKRPMILGIEKRSRCDSRDEESMMQNYWGLPWRGADRDDVEVGEI